MQGLYLFVYFPGQSWNAAPACPQTIPGREITHDLKRIYQMEGKKDVSVFFEFGQDFRIRGSVKA